MNLKKRHFLFPLYLFSLVCLLLALYFYFYRSYDFQANIWKTIPADVSIIARTNSCKNLWTNFSKTDQWKELSYIHPVQNFIGITKHLDSLANHYAEFNDMLTQNKAVFSLHPAESDQLQLLFLLELKNYRQKRYIINIINKSSFQEPTAISHKSTKIVKITLTGIENCFYYSINKGLFLASQDPYLIRKSIDHLLHGESIEIDNRFQEVYVTTGKKADANIFINNANLRNLLNPEIIEENELYYRLFQYLPNWTALDMKIKNKEILLNGYSSRGEKSHSILEVFSGQKPPSENLLLSYIPAATTVMLYQNFNDLNSYIEGFKFFLSQNNFSKELESIKNSGLHLETLLPDGINHEMALTAMRTGRKGSNEELFMIFKAPADYVFRNLLDPVSEVVEPSNQFFPDIMRLKAVNPFQFFFIPFINNKSFDHYLILEDCILFGQETGQLKKYFSDYKSGQILSKSKQFAPFIDNISESSNIFFYFNPGRSINMFARGIHQRDGDAGAQSNENFPGFALQFSVWKELYYTNFYFNSSSVHLPEQPYLWRTEIESEIIHGPFLTKNHTTGGSDIIVFDNLNQVYFIDNYGQIKWKKLLTGPVLSDVYLVDYYKNGKIQYLFNTNDHIYLLDLNGQNVEGYPVKLPVEATNPVNVIDYADKKDYRLFFAGEDKKIYNFTIQGKPVSGWKNPKVPSTVTRPVQHLAVNKKDYIIIPQDDGQVLMTDRKGNTRMKIKKSFRNGLRSLFYENKTNSKGSIITTDINGNLIYIPEKGKISTSSFGKFTSEHYFFYEDFDNDNYPDFIFIDKNRLSIFNRFKKPLLQYEFEHHVDLPPQLIKLSKNLTLLSFTFSNGKKFFLFSSKGIINEMNQVEGNTVTKIADIDNDGVPEIIIGEGKQIKCYPLRF